MPENSKAQGGGQTFCEGHFVEYTENPRISLSGAIYFLYILTGA